MVKDIEAASYLSLIYRLRMPARQRFAVHGAGGFVAKPYHLRDGQRYVDNTGSALFARSVTSDFNLRYVK